MENTTFKVPACNIRQCCEHKIIANLKMEQVGCVVHTTQMGFKEGWLSERSMIDTSVVGHKL
jgi:hypothetical protein